ncbi:MAG: winged helix-turn-helix domain-containing protein [Cyanobacteria bacterium J06626_18]
MRCLLVGDKTFLKETACLLNQTNYELSGCSFPEALTKIALNHPDCVFIHLDAVSSLSGFFLQLPQRLQDQGSYSPILVAVAPHETSRDQELKYYRMGFELVVEAPVSIHLLIARLKVLIRRIGIDNTTTQSSHLLLNGRTRDCFLKTHQGELLGFFKATPMQFDIIQLLAQHPRWRWSREQLESTLSHKISRIDKRAVDVAISRLRERFREQIHKLPPDSWHINPPHRYPFIHTEHGGGYYFLDCLQLGKEPRAATPSLPPIRQGRFTLQPNSTRPFPFSIQDCEYSWDNQS